LARDDTREVIEDAETWGDRSPAIDLLRLQALKAALGLDRGCIKGEGTAIIPGGRGVITEPLLRQTTVEIGQRKARIELDRPGEVADRALVLLAIEVGVAAVVGN